MYHNGTTAWGAFGRGSSNAGAALRTRLSNIPTYALTSWSTSSNSTWEAHSIPDTYALVYLTPSGAPANYNWANVKAHQAKDRWTIIHQENNSAMASLGSTAVNSPLHIAGYSGYTSSGTTSTFSTADALTHTKLHQFLLNTHSATPNTPITASITTSFDGDSNSTAFGTVPATTSMRVLTRTAGTVLSIDIYHRLIWLGEAEVFASISNNSNADRMFDNLMYFIGNASKYGTHFTDLLLNDSQSNYLGQPAQPAPWDSYWDARGSSGTDNRGVPSK
jgi:hypothetical protein